MPARQGKSKEKIKTHICTNDFYKHFKDISFDENMESKLYIDRATYGKFIKTFFEELVEAIIYENYEFKIPFRLGTLCIRKYKSSVKVTEDGKVINNLPIDWNETLKLWDRDPEAKKNKKRIKHLNKHSDGYVYRFTWIKKDINLGSKYYWWFKPTRTNKLKLKSAINNKMVDFYKVV